MGEEMFNCSTRIRVRYGETDKMGVAHHGAMVTWLEVGRVEWCRAVGVPYSEVEAAGFNMAVAELTVRYMKPIFFDEKITIETVAENFTARLARFSYRIFNSKQELAVVGSTRHLVVGKTLIRTSLSPELMTRFRRVLEQDA